MITQECLEAIYAQDAVDDKMTLDDFIKLEPWLCKHIAAGCIYAGMNERQIKTTLIEAMLTYRATKATIEAEQLEGI